MPGLLDYPHYEAAHIKILADGCNGGISPGQFWAQLKIQCDTAYIWEFLFFVYGLPTAGITQVGLGLPMAYPYQAGLFADNATWEAIGIQEHVCEWKTVIFTIHFKTLPFDESMRTVEMKFAGNFITLPEGAFIFSDGTTTKGAGVFVPECDFVVKYHRQAQQFINYPLINSLSGKTNTTMLKIGSPISPPELNFSPGTVLYMGADVTLETNYFGFNLCTISHSFSYRQILHNYLLNPNTGVFDAPQNIGGKYIYDDAELNDLVLL